MEFQSKPNVIEWKLQFQSPPKKVYEALSTNEGRKKYWAESAEEKDGKIHYVFLNEIEDTGEILEAIPERKFKVTYFGWHVSFDLEQSEGKGTVMTMLCEGVSDKDKMEISSGWVSWLLTMKAAVDFDVDLRNHNPERTWFHGFADN